METVRAEKQKTDGDLQSKVDELQKKKAQIESLENEVNASRRTCKEVEERLGKMTRKFEETQQHSESKEEVGIFTVPKLFRI